MPALRILGRIVALPQFGRAIGEETFLPFVAVLRERTAFSGHQRAANSRLVRLGAPFVAGTNKSAQTIGRSRLGTVFVVPTRAKWHRSLADTEYASCARLVAFVIGLAAFLSRHAYPRFGAATLLATTDYLAIAVSSPTVGVFPAVPLRCLFPAAAFLFVGYRPDADKVPVTIVVPPATDLFRLRLADAGDFWSARFPAGTGIASLAGLILSAFTVSPTCVLRFRLLLAHAQNPRIGICTCTDETRGAIVVTSATRNIPPTPSELGNKVGERRLTACHDFSSDAFLSRRTIRSEPAGTIRGAFQAVPHHTDCIVPTVSGGDTAFLISVLRNAPSQFRLVAADIAARANCHVEAYVGIWTVFP